MFRLLTWLILLGLVGCIPAHGQPTMVQPSPTVIQNIPVTPGLPITAIVNGTILTGTDSDPIPDGVVLIQADRIIAVGKANTIQVPDGAEIIDSLGGTILPGFINTHIHSGYSKSMLQQWLQGGVTTVRDEGTGSGSYLDKNLALRDSLITDPNYARLISAGAMMTVPGGYGQIQVSTTEEAVAAVNSELDQGVDQIKVSLEDGYAGKHNLPKLTPAQLKAIVETAHGRGARVSGHITQAAYIPPLLDAGVDDIAHDAWDPIPPETIQRMVDQGVYFIPTFTVFRNYDAPMDQCVLNLKAFVEAGGLVALGNDYGGGPGKFDVGIPMYEVEMMQKAGMSAKQIIQAGTRNAAVVIGLQDQLGTLEPGKVADILILDGDPLKDLTALTRIKAVFHLGKEVALNKVRIE